MWAFLSCRVPAGKVSTDSIRLADRLMGGAPSVRFKEAPDRQRDKRRRRFPD
jgi:hypothetical protein